VVTHLVDGDTLDVRLEGGGGERVRLIGIDTPETKKPNTPVQCFGPEASVHLAQLVPVGTAVTLLRDEDLRDVYGRFLAYVFRREDGKFVNLAMAEDGFARVLSIAPNTTFATDFASAVEDAQHAKRGLWAACPTS
jgi:micrococcal nuclease